MPQKPPFQIPQPRLYAFDKEDTDWKQLSVLHKKTLVVANGPDLGLVLDNFIKQIIRHDPITKIHHFDADDPHDENYVLKHLAVAGYTAYFLPIDTYLSAR